MAVLLQPVRAVVFDAAGTLLSPKRSVGFWYAAALARRGLPADAADLDRRFPKAFKAVRAGKPYPDSEDAELAFRREVVRGTLGDACPPALFEPVFAELFALFGTGEPWVVAPDAVAVLSALRFLGLRVALLSNADRRMRTVLAQLGLASHFEQVFLSAETGFPKPDRRAFDAVVRRLGLPSQSVMHVGDSREEDAGGAVAAGLRACWLTADKTTVVPGAHRVGSLIEVVDLVRAEAVAHNERRGFDRPVRNMLADLRGLPIEPSRSSEKPMMRMNGIADLLRRARDGEAGALKGVSDLARHAIGAEETGMDARGVLLDAWSSVVPPRLRDKCFPVDLDRESLVVYCSSPVARNELRFAERALIAAVRRLPGCSGVSKIAYRM